MEEALLSKEKRQHKREIESVIGRLEENEEILGQQQRDGRN